MNLPPQGNHLRADGHHFSTLKVESQSTPNMSLRVTPGLIWVNGNTAVEYSGGNTGNFVAPLANAKWDLLVLRHNGALDIIKGAESNNPIFPMCPAKCFPLAAVFLKNTDTSITYDMINDVKPIFNIPVQSHNELTKLDVADVHPISAIQDLTKELSDRYTISTIDNLISTKANVTGTSEQSFKINENYTGTPVSNCGIEVERGSENNVVFRFNEAIDCWEYTNDGITFISLAATSSGMTGAEIKTAYEAENDTNVFDDAAVAKLSSIAMNATADMTGSQIKTAYEAENDTNVFDDAAVAKLASLKLNGASTSRPNAPGVGDSFFDSTLGMPIWYNGTAWIDAAKNVV